MVFVFIEDGTLDIVADLSEVYKTYEGIDVENEVYRFFDDQGRYLEPHFTVPNQYGKFLWLFNWCRSGEYKLIPNPNANTDSLGRNVSTVLRHRPA